MRRRLVATELKAGQVLHLVYNKGYTQSLAAVLVELNVGTVCHIVHGRRFPTAYPIPFPEV